VCARLAYGQTDPDALVGQVLGPRDRFHIESIAVRTTYFDQTGLGFQSQAGPPQGPGSEALTVWQPQAEVVARQGDRVTHRLWVPVDIVTAASPDAVDAVSSASRVDEAGSLELATTYRTDGATELTFQPGFHLEEQMRAWHLGGAVTQSLADGNATVSARFDHNVDWLDVFTIHGQRRSRAIRTTSNASIGVTQLLSPTTIANANYGLTVQLGELGNTWNSVPLADGERAAELLPRIRQRHALVGRIAQWLPWNGAVHARYRFYADDWGLVAHSAEAELYQRLMPWLYLRANYRYHTQSGVSFFAEHPSGGAILRTSDSDLAPLHAHTVGGMAAIELLLPALLRHRSAHIELEYDRYWRSNGLHVDIYTGAIALSL
jgi:hypothetical protein